MRIRPLLAAAGLGVLVAPALDLVQSGAASATLPGIVIGGCTVNTTATVTPGLTLAPEAFSYSYTGTLSSCFYTGSGPSAHGGVITAGGTIDIDGHAYQEPTPTGSGSCLLTQAVGYDFTRWDNGNQTVVQFTATSIAGVTTITGHVVDSIELRAVDPAPGEPATATFRTDQFNGQTVLGVVDFGASNPTACLGSPGLTTAAISGQLTHSMVVG